MSPVGSHKLNSAIPQAYYNAKQGIRHITTETGAGQWGSSMSIARDPECQGSLGMAISEAVEMALKTPHCRYTLDSVLNHVLLHQTIIGLEAEKQLAMAGDYPDKVIACFGGGSNFAGIVFPFLRRKLELLRGESLSAEGIPASALNTRFIAAEPASCPGINARNSPCHQRGSEGKRGGPRRGDIVQPVVTCSSTAKSSNM